MFKIEIAADDGRQLKISKENFLYFMNAEGTDSYWEWEHIRGRAADLEPLFEQARELLASAEKRLPDLPMPGGR
ncbi:MAG: hypothetical protein WBG37_02230 [Desulfobacterales bacterium]